MSHNAGSDGEVVASTSFEEKAPHTVVINDVATFDINSQDLPKGYYHSPLFVGTLIASGLSVMAVSSTGTTIQRTQN